MRSLPYPVLYHSVLVHSAKGQVSDIVISGHFHNNSYKTVVTIAKQTKRLFFFKKRIIELWQQTECLYNVSL